MGFYISENWRAEKKAVIHRGECGHCNNGEGTGRNIRGNENCKWHGPFGSYEEVREFAESLKDREVRDCKKCRPETLL